ncbi:MAG: hypothetical protein JRF60_02595 [Deltaproteobacteria bacterium]|nr:hypothetical protein [Deltaproteobacteria bacterium]MBW2563780.1 hypothetical protein [Deltaproteobacteria bacterium]
MINAIGEASIQQTMRTNQNNVVYDKEIIEQKATRVIKERPVEKTDDSPKSKMDTQPRDTARTRNTIEDGKIILEKYDKDGKLIQRIPPGYVPFGERA